MEQSPSPSDAAQGGVDDEHHEASALPAVVVRSLGGDVVVSDAEVTAIAADGGAGAHVGALRAAAARALRVGPGLQCRLVHGLRPLEDTTRLVDAFEGSGDTVQVTAVVDTAPAVRAMLDQFASCVEKLSDTKVETFLPLFREGTGVERLIDLLLHLGEEAAPAAHRFEDWASHRHPTVRRLVAWAMGGMGREAGALVELLAGIVRNDPHEIVRYEAARSMFQIAEALPLEALSRLAAAVADHEDDGLRVQAYRGLRVVAREDIRVGLCARREVREALSPHLVRALADRVPEVRLSAMRALSKIDPLAFRSELQQDLIDDEAWKEAEARLEARLRTARQRRGDPGDRQAAACRHEAGAQARGNEAEFPLLAGLLPVALRAEGEREAVSGDGEVQRRRPFTCDTSVNGEAAWSCMPRSCIRRDATTRGQELVMAKRTMRGALLAAMSAQRKGLRACLVAHVFLRLEGVKSRPGPTLNCKERKRAVGKAGISRSAAQGARREYLKRYFSCYPQGAHFFRRLDGIEGRDPMHQWLFPKVGAPPLQDFEPFHKPRALRSWRTVWGGDVRFLP